MITPEMIHAFLSVMEYGNLSAAANNTFTTQGQISKQLRLLEEEVGTTLLIRKKGMSRVELTSHGREFLKLARQWQGFMEAFYDIRNLASITEISICALDRLNTFTLQDYYRWVLDHHTDIRVDVHTRHSKEIYSMMEGRRTDIGLVSILQPVYHINITRLYDEPMKVICYDRPDLSETIRPEDLDPAKEIYSRWSDEYEIWHNHWFPEKQYRIHMGTTSMTPHYMNQPGRWSIVPVSILNKISEDPRITSHTFTVQPPRRSIYLLTQKNIPENKEAVLRRFIREMLEYLQQDPKIELNSAALSAWSVEQD